MGENVLTKLNSEERGFIWAYRLRELESITVEGTWQYSGKAWQQEQEVTLSYTQKTGT